MKKIVLILMVVAFLTVWAYASLTNTFRNVYGGEGVRTTGFGSTD